MRLANRGWTPNEIAEELELPECFLGLSVQGITGRQPQRQIRLQQILGWYDANPAHLNPPPPKKPSEKYVEFMGGPEKVLRQARTVSNR
ncbi:MAG: hypothetical protein Ct9H300mP26_5680 [Acidimicrobiales bacterium]|nr:MAG: hypothetical protein Ct9H300mP26_5680 [Acidimicrobiales bacterium]